MTPENEPASVFITSIILVILEIGRSGNWTSSVIVCSSCSFISVLILNTVYSEKSAKFLKFRLFSVVLARPP